MLSLALPRSFRPGKSGRFSVYRIVAVKTYPNSLSSSAEIILDKAISNLDSVYT
jgi:hypothetical protein